MSTLPLPSSSFLTYRYVPRTMIAKNLRRNPPFVWKFRKKKKREGKVDGIFQPTAAHQPIEISTQFSCSIMAISAPKSFRGFPSSVTILPSFETGTLEASIKLRLFKREKFPGNLFKSAAINYRHVRGLSLFILARTFSLSLQSPFLPLLYSRPWSVDLGISSCRGNGVRYQRFLGL